MLSSYLDKNTGLTYFWSRIKNIFIKKPATATAGQVLTYDGTDWAAGSVTIDIGLSVVNGQICVTYDDGGNT